MVAHRPFGHLLRGLRRQAVLGLAHKGRFADETGYQRAAARDQILAGDLRGLFIGGEFAIGLNPFQDRRPKARDVGAALGRGDGVTVGLDEPVARGRPVDCPFDLARLAELGFEIDRA